MRHIKKIVIIAAVLLTGLVTVTALTACGGSISTGFKTQVDLVKKYFAMEKEYAAADIEGKMPSFNEAIRFFDTSKLPPSLIAIVKEMYEISAAELKDNIDLIKDGNYETYPRNEDGKFRKISKEDYEKELAEIRDIFDSYVFISAEKDNDLTKDAQEPNKIIEVWILKYEYYDYTDGIKDSEKTEIEEELELIKIGNRWYLNEDFLSAMSPFIPSF